jgi:hypothetical protein
MGMTSVVTKRGSGANVATHRDKNEAVPGQEARLGIVVHVFDVDLMEQRLGGRPPAGDATLSLTRPTVPDHLAPIVSDRDPAEPVVFYFLVSPPNGASACFGADDRDGTAPNSATFDAAVIELQRVTFAARWRRLLFYWSRQQSRAQRRLAKRHGRVRVRAGVGELRHDLPTGNGPSPGRLVRMSPCRALAPPAQLVAPLSADALGTAA